MTETALPKQWSVEERGRNRRLWYDANSIVVRANRLDPAYDLIPSMCEACIKKVTEARRG